MKLLILISSIFFLFALNFKSGHSFRNIILNKDLVEEKLHVILVLENPCLFSKRYSMTRQFLNRMKNEKYVVIYILELCYYNQKPFIIDHKNPRHMAIFTTSTPLWHKENLINIAVKKLLPTSWKAFAWIDSDIKFENQFWALDTLKVLKSKKDIVQLFSQSIDTKNNDYHFSVGYHFEKNMHNYSINPKFWHPGYAWAIKRTFYEKIGGLFEYNILGGSDYRMALCIVGHGMERLFLNYSASYLNELKKYQKKATNIKFGFVPGIVRHEFHGNYKNRKYFERNFILIRHQFDPNIHLQKLNNGLIVPSKLFSKQFSVDILNYFKQRKEDE